MCIYTYTCVNYKENPPEFYLNVISWWHFSLSLCLFSNISTTGMYYLCNKRHNNYYYYYYDDDYKKM